MTNHKTPLEVQTVIDYMVEFTNMLSDLEMLTDDYQWSENYHMEMGQLAKCVQRVISSANREKSGLYREAMEAQEPVVETVVETVVEPEIAPEPVVETQPEPEPEPETIVEPEPIVEPVQESQWDVEKYCEYFEEYKHVTCDNYEMLIAELMEVGDGSPEHLLAVEDLIEEAWGLNCGFSLNENLGRFEAQLEQLKAGNKVSLPVQTSVTEVEVVSSDIAAPEDAEEQMDTETIDMSIFNNYTWWSDENHNGKPQDIFGYALEIDPNTCSLEDFLHGLLYSRIDRGDGKGNSLKVDEIIEICSLRTFPGIHWPVNGKGVTIKTKAKALITPKLAALKEENDYTKAGLKELTKHGYPTHAHYRQEYLNNCVNVFDTPADQLEGDDLDSMCAGIDLDSMEIRSVSETAPAPVAEPEPETTKEIETSAAQKALDFLNR